MAVNFLFSFVLSIFFIWKIVCNSEPQKLPSSDFACLVWPSRETFSLQQGSVQNVFPVFEDQLPSLWNIDETSDCHQKLLVAYM